MLVPFYPNLKCVIQNFYVIVFRPEDESADILDQKEDTKVEEDSDDDGRYFCGPMYFCKGRVCSCNLTDLNFTDYFTEDLE